MKKYITTLTKRETKEAKLFANSREDAVKLLKEDFPKWDFEIITEVVKDQKEDEDGEYVDHEIYGFCESTDRPIFYGDYYYQWGGDDAVMTHLDLGGADENHKPTLAE